MSMLGAEIAYQFQRRVPRKLADRVFKPKGLFNKTYKDGTWVCEGNGKHTRVILTNLESPYNTMLTARKVPIMFQLYSEMGKRICRREFLSHRDETLVLEVADLLPKNETKPVNGLLESYAKAPSTGTLRYYVQWYDKRSLTSTHSKYDSVPYVRERHFLTIDRCISDSTQETAFAICNLGKSKIMPTINIVNHRKELKGGSIEPIAPRGSRFLRVGNVLPNSGVFLEGKSGVLYFDGLTEPVIVYQFVIDLETGSWVVQHY